MLKLVGEEVPGVKPCSSAPCRECPFRRTSVSGWLGGNSVDFYLVQSHSDLDIVCHMSPGFRDAELVARSCKGLAIYRRNVGKQPRGGSALVATKLSKPDRELVFATPQEFRQHHTNGGAVRTIFDLQR